MHFADARLSRWYAYMYCTFIGMCAGVCTDSVKCMFECKCHCTVHACGVDEHVL